MRELKQVVHRLMSRYPGEGPLTAASIPEAERHGVRRRLAARKADAFEAAVRAALSQGCGLEAMRKSVAEAAYSIVLAEERGDTGRAAVRLKVSKRAVQMFVKDHHRPGLARREVPPSTTMP